jgi:diguanylate cyclase (GGDEF)-like protein
MSRVEHLKQGLIAGVRDRSWRARRERDLQARRWAFLAEAGHLLEASLDFDSTLERIASLVVPSIGDCAVVHVVDPDGSIRRMAVTHADPAKAALAAERGDEPPQEDAPAGPGKVIRTGEPELIPDSSMVVPLRARGRTLGTLSVISDESGRHYDEEDLALLQELAARCALAADNARLYADARDAAERLSRQALYDPLTGLPNRTLFVDRLERAIARSDRSQVGPAVMFLDLDGFKLVNDTVGHSGGDQLLQLVAERLGEAVRVGDTVARMGGDEFTVLCDSLADDEEAPSVAERVIEALSRPFTVGSREIRIGASVGISLAKSARDYPATLIREADIAMYQAKDAGRGRWEIFRDSMVEGTGELEDMAAALRQAVASEGFSVAYEPVVDTNTGRASAAEALVSWQHPTRGLLDPREFGPLAEETGLIHAIGAFAFETAARQAQDWCAQRPDGPPTRVLVDVSAAELTVAELPELVERTLDATGIAPAWLCLEIATGTLMDDSRAIANSLLALKGLGVGLAADRFGAGEASLAALQRVPLDYVKIDPLLVRRLGRRPEDSAMVAAIARMAEPLGIEPIAVGVETAEQLEELAAVGVRLVQGPFVAPAGPPEDVLELVGRV